ncbi:MAG: amidohydrolase family protein, partial [Thermoplasmata archaeon]|nr:amidohydrolase family protein [Thermoplasmata archaeon]
VTAGHCCAMAGWSKELTDRVIGKVKAADINIITNTPVNLVIQGRGDEVPFRRGIPKVKALLEAGVNVSCGQDDLLNMFYPFGQMDMLEVVNFVVHAAQLSSPEEVKAAFDMPRYGAAKVMRIKDYDIKVGNPANLVLIDAKDALDTIRHQAGRLFVIKNGKVLVENQRSTIFHPSVPAQPILT